MVCSQPACSAAAAESLQSCPTLCDPMNCSLSGSSVHGILQERILEWVAMPSSRGSSRPRDQTCISYISCIGRQFLYHKSHLESLYISSSVHGILQKRILKWVAIPFSRGYSWLRDQTWVSHSAGRLFIIWATSYVYAPLWSPPRIIEFSIISESYPLTQL